MIPLHYKVVKLSCCGRMAATRIQQLDLKFISIIPSGTMTRASIYILSTYLLIYGKMANIKKSLNVCSQTKCVKLCVGVSGPRSCVCSQQQACTASEDNILQTQPAVAQVGHSLHCWVISSLSGGNMQTALRGNRGL